MSEPLTVTIACDFGAHLECEGGEPEEIGDYGTNYGWNECACRCHGRAQRGVKTMIIKLICWLWGHKTMLKATTGTFQTVNQVTGYPQTGHYYRWQRNEFCVRCGTKVHEPEPQQEAPAATAQKEAK